MATTDDFQDPPSPEPQPKDPKETNDEDAADTPPIIPKVHHVTVCMVPPPEAEKVWKTVGDMRKQLKDPGYYRWPPHANLLYPFLEVHNSEHLPEILAQLQSAASQIEPFSICLHQLGTFGGKQRGVLWLRPDSSTEGDPNGLVPPLTQLHRKLEEAFPMCRDQTKGGVFTPHMTLSHFENLDDALAAQKEIEQDFAEQQCQLDFVLDRIYLLRRQGDSGQFLRVADIGLGGKGVVEHWGAPRSFPDMPIHEEDWVYEERMKLKKRRNSGRGKRGGSKRSPRHREPRIPDTPEITAAKRAERKAKRERLEREQQDLLQRRETPEDSSD